MPTLEQIKQVREFLKQSKTPSLADKKIKKSDVAKKTNPVSIKNVVRGEVVKGNGLDLDKMRRAAKESYDGRFVISEDGTDAKLKFGRFKDQMVSVIETKCPDGSDYLFWVLREGFPKILTDIIKYRKGLIDAITKEEMHGEHEEQKEEKLKGPFFDLDIHEWPQHIVDAKPKCPRCGAGIGGLFAYVQNPIFQIEEYHFCCTRCAQKFQYKIEEIKCQKTK